MNCVLVYSRADPATPCPDCVRGYRAALPGRQSRPDTARRGPPVNRVAPSTARDMGTLIGCCDDGSANIDAVCEIEDTASVTRIGGCSLSRQALDNCVRVT